MSNRISNLLVELHEERQETIDGLPHLSLQLSPEESVAVQLRFVRETVVLASERFTQMPNVHPCLMGLIEHRSNVFWVLDLAQLLGLSPLDSTAIETHIAILQIGGAFLGLGVYRIGRVVRFSETEILSLEKIPRTKAPIAITPFLRGWLPQSEGSDRDLYVLDADKIALNDLKSRTT